MVQVFQPAAIFPPTVHVMMPVTETSISDAITAAQTRYPDGARVLIPGGQGDITPSVSTSPAVRLSAGKVTVEAGEGTTFLPYPGTAQHTWFLAQPSTLSVGSAQLITVNVARYSNTITIGAGIPAGWVEGDIIQLQQNEYSAGQADGYLTLKIESKTATTATFYESIPTPFTTARTAIAVKLVTIDDVTFKGIKGDGTGNTNDFTCLIGANNYQNLSFYDCGGPHFDGGWWAGNLAGYNLYQERCDGDYSGFDDGAGNQLAAFGTTNCTHVTRVNCHADNSPGEGFLDWSCAYVTTFNDRSVGPYNRGIESHNVWNAKYFGGTFNGSRANAGIDFNGNSYNIKYIGCEAVGNAFAGLSAIDAGLIPDDIWAIGCTFRGSPWVSGTSADIVLSGGTGRVHIVDCEYDTIYDNSVGSLIRPSRSGHVSVIYDSAAQKVISATATETTMLASAYKGPGPTLAGDFWTSAMHIRIKSVGALSNLNGDSITIQAQTGAVLLCETGAVTPGSGLTSAYFEVTVDIDIYTDGTSANVSAIGKFVLRGAGFTDGYAPMVNAVAPTLNTQVAQTLDLTAKYSSNNAANVLSILKTTIEVL